MIDEGKEEMAAMYALGVLESHEALSFEEEMKKDPELRAFVDDLLRHSTALAHTCPVKAAPLHLREKVLDKIRASGEKMENVLSFERPRARFPWVPWAMAAGFAIACGLLFKDHSRLKNQIAELRRDNDVCQMQVAMLGSMSSESPQGQAVVVWDSSTQTGVLRAENMPRPAANQEYQIWMVDPKYSEPVNAGVFNVDERGVATAIVKPTQPVTTANKFAVSIEPKGGVPQHTSGPIVMSSK